MTFLRSLVILVGLYFVRSSTVVIAENNIIFQDYVSYWYIISVGNIDSRYPRSRLKEVTMCDVADCRTSLPMAWIVVHELSGPH